MTLPTGVDAAAAAMRYAMAMCVEVAKGDRWT
jgi:hypothetical protein